MSDRTRAYLLTAAVAALSFAADAAAAQDSSSQLEEVIVTARRSEENLQSVPVTIKAFSAESIRENGIRSTNDLMNVTPGIYTASSGSPTNTLYSIRGQGKPVAGNGGAGVVTYFAEVPLPTIASGIPQYDLSNIQVLKGPQGTLFGRNTLGGAVLVYPNAPTYAFGGYAQATIGRYDWREFEGAINLPLIEDKAALRVAGRFARRDGFTKNLGGEGEVSDLNNEGFRVSLLLEPTDWIKNTLILDYNHDSGNGPAQVVVQVNDFVFNAPPFNGTTPPFSLIQPFVRAQYAAQLARGPRVVDTGALSPFETVKRKGLTNRTELTLGENLSVVNIMGYRRIDYNSFTNISGLPTLFLAPGVPFDFLKAARRFNIEQYSEEFQLRGSAFGDRLNWIGGAFYLKEQPKGPNYTSLVILNGRSAGYDFLTTKSRALFANVSFDLSDFLDGLKFNAGYRYTWDRVSDCAAGSLAAPAPIDFTVTKATCLPTNPNIRNAQVTAAKSKAPTWTIGLDYQVNDDVFLYVTSRRGYRAGGVNGPALGAGLSAYQGFDPETVTDFEAGAHTDWRAGGMTGRFNVSVFTQKNKKVQVPISGITTSSFPGVCVGNPPAPVWIDGDCNAGNDPANGTLIFNIGETRVNGIEVDAAIKPIDSLTLTFSGTLMDQKILKVSAPPIGGVIPNVAQTFFRNAPEKGYTAGFRYVLPTSESFGELTASALYTWISRINQGGYIQPSYDNLNLRLDLQNAGGRPVDIAAFVRNATNEKATIASAVSTASFPFNSGLYNEPRLYGVEVRFRFGAN